MIFVSGLDLPDTEGRGAQKTEDSQYNRVLHHLRDLAMSREIVVLEHSGPQLQEQLQILLPLVLLLVLGPHQPRLLLRYSS